MGKVNILLADDHAIVRAGIRKTVEEIPDLMVVAEVGNGIEVFSALQLNAIDCLLIDITMPDFDPIIAIRKIRSLYPALKILVISAYDDDFYVQGLLSAGVNGYHLKDQPLNDLKLAIDRVLAGERWISSILIDRLVEPHPNTATTHALTNRQRDLLHLLQLGLDNQSMSQQTGLSVKTIENHLTRLYRQLNVRSRLETMNLLMRFPQLLGRPGQDAAQGDDQAGMTTAKQVTILVVDDNPRYCKQLQRMIGKLYPQATIYEAADIQAALNIVQKVEIQLAFVDVVLGDENGISCSRRIKNISPGCRIILISAYPDREFHHQGLKSGAVAFLDKKDLDLPTLRQVIDDVP